MPETTSHSKNVEHQCSKVRSTPKNPSASKENSFNSVVVSSPNAASCADTIELASIARLNQLLQNDDTLGQAQVIQIPTELLRSLISSVTDMKKEIALLKSSSPTMADFMLLKEQAAQLQERTRLSLEHADLSFIYFPRLPSEIRIMIWKYSLVVPRVIVYKLGDEFNSVSSPALAQLHTCRESRQQALQMMQVPPSRSHELESQICTLDGFEPCNTQWIMNLPSRWEVCSLISYMRSGNKVAIAMEEWYIFCWFDRSDNDFLYSIMTAGIKEIILIVKGDDALRNRRDLVFIPPQRYPAEIIEYQSAFSVVFSSFHPGALLLGDNPKWTDLARDMKNRFQNAYDEVARAPLKRIYEHNRHKPELKGLTFYPRESESWNVPDVHFMDLSTLEQQRRLGRL